MTTKKSLSRLRQWPTAQERELNRDRSHPCSEDDRFPYQLSTPVTNQSVRLRRGSPHTNDRSFGTRSVLGPLYEVPRRDLLQSTTIRCIPLIERTGTPELIGDPVRSRTGDTDTLAVELDCLGRHCPAALLQVQTHALRRFQSLVPRTLSGPFSSSIHSFHWADQ